MNNKRRNFRLTFAAAAALLAVIAFFLVSCSATCRARAWT
jgi:hypothetical protein